MKKQFLTIFLFSLFFGCSSHSSEYSKSPKKPLWGHHYDSVIAAAPRMNYPAQKTLKHVIDTFVKQYDTSVFRYIPIKDSIYTFYFKSDSFRDVKGKPLFDSLTKKYKTYPDTFLVLSSYIVQEIKRSAIDTTKIK